MAEIRESYLIRIASDPPARVWTGFGTLVIPADIVENEPAEYIGAGDLVRISDFQQLINGNAERLDMVLSGVSAEALRLALEDAPSVKGAAVHIGRVDFDADWQILGVEWEAVFRADSLGVESSPTDEHGNRKRAITLSIGSDDTGRSRAPNAYFTDGDQRRRSPTDAIFSHVGKIMAETSRRFGPK